MNEITITTGKVIHNAGHTINIWEWQISLYLFLGGLTAGILIIAAWSIIKGKEYELPLATNQIIIFAPVFMSLGMLCLFIDLSHRIFVWRFYTTFSPTSVMSWGAWVLLLVYPFSFLLSMGVLRKGFPKLYVFIKHMLAKLPKNIFTDIFDSAIVITEKNIIFIAKITIPLGIFLGIYTGILLSSLNARIFWNSPILGPLFLVSGISTSAAIIVLVSKYKLERQFFGKIDLVLISIELVLLILFLIGLATSTEQHKLSLKLVMGGELTHIFWIFVVGFALIIPAAFEIIELSKKKVPYVIAPIFVLVGGLILRFVFVEAGQITSWLPY